MFHLDLCRDGCGIPGRRRRRRPRRETRAVLSTGEVVANPKALNRYARKMARLQRELSRRERGANHRRDTKRRLARVRRSVRTCRADALHQLSSRLASTYGTVAPRVSGRRQAPW